MRFSSSGGTRRLRTPPADREAAATVEIPTGRSGESGILQENGWKHRTLNGR
jgi:hypothetical protein